MMRLEWGDADTAEISVLSERNIATFAEVNDVHPDQEWLVINVENGGIALKGTREELLQLLASAFTQVLEYA